MTRSVSRAAALLVGLVAMAGCADRDPYARTDVWQPTGSNAANIAAMVANPNDLVRGHGVTRIDSRLPVAAVERLWTDHPRSLGKSASESNSSKGDSGAGGDSGGGGPASPPGG